MALPRRALAPWWLVLLVFLPLEVWLFLKMRDVWGLVKTILAFLVLGFLAARASRPRGILAWLFPTRAERKAAARPVWLALLLLAAAFLWWSPFGPQPWLPAAACAFGAKALVS